MIIYNVTVKIEHGIESDWLQWMRNVHIPDVIKTGQFVGHRLCRLLEQDEEDGVTYAVQYFCNSLDNINKYREHYATALQAEHQRRYGNHYVAFRTILEVLE
ncbi:MAG: DUF4286 family protein [Sphingobacteriales bacterium]|nr:DUF4286 family protein [Sphingobacteriales bacterium]